MGTKSRGRDGLYRRGTTWWLRRDPITGTRVSTGCHDLAAARLWRAERERLAAAPADAAAKTQSIGRWMTRLVELKGREGGEGRADYYRKTLGPWVRIVGNDVAMASVTPELVDLYVSTRRSEGVTDHTITKEFACVRQALQLAKRGGAYPGDLDALRPPDLHQSYTPRKRALRPHELVALLTALEGDRAAFVALAATLGLRKGEVEGLLPSDVDLTRGVVHVRGTKTVGANREVAILPQWRPLTEQALALLPLRPWHTGSCVRDLARACRRAGIAKCTPNDLRRTYATLLVEGGASLDVVRRLMGHTSTAMVERVYGRPDPVAIGELAAGADLPRLGRIGTTTSQWVGADEKSSAPDLIRTGDLSLRKPVRSVKSLENAACANAEERQKPLCAAVAGNKTVQRRHTPQAWSLAYAYRDVLSRRAVA